MTGPAVACPECGEHFAEAFEHCPQDGSRLGQVDALCERELGGRYFILAQMGRGDLGSIYAASDERLHRRVAIKVLHPEVAHHHAQLDRFRQELKALSQVGHEHIVDVTDFQRDEGLLYFAMEYLRGQTLEALLARATRLSLEQTVHIADQCCRALATAHARGIVHHDLKPANVFLTSQGGRSDFVKLLDFGMDKLQAPERVRSGGSHYVSPEQAAGRPADARADQYALGVMMFEMLTGCPPFEGASTLAVLQQHLDAPVRRFESIRPGLNVPLGIEGVVQRALKKQPEERFADIGALRSALRDAMRALHREQLHAAFNAYDVPLPTSDAERKLSGLDPDTYALLERLRRTLTNEQQRLLREQREAHRQVERELTQKISVLEAQLRDLGKQLHIARDDGPLAE